MHKKYLSKRTDQIVQSNYLINSSYTLSINQKRLLMLALTSFDSKKCYDLKPIKVYTEDFIKKFNVNSSSAYQELRTAADTLIERSIRMYDEDTDKVVKLSWIIKCEYLRSTAAFVEIIFSPLLTKYLFDLSKHFTSIDFKYVSHLNTVFSVRLYEWLKQHERMKVNRFNGVVTVNLDVDWMKEKTGVVGYKRFGDFETSVIKPAVNKIICHTDLSVCYTKIKRNRKVVSVEFSYVVESNVTKPIRPRLFRRPKVKKGSHEEGVWMNKNLALLLNYECVLKEYDAKAKLTLPDLKKMALYAAVSDTYTQERINKEISLRSNKSKKAA